MQGMKTQIKKTSKNQPCVDEAVNLSCEACCAVLSALKAECTRLRGDDTVSLSSTI
jgi:hypothetical protein